MHKPLELPFRLRIWHFIRGLLFYNTVYWKRASDGLKPPKLSRKERLLHQPARDLAMIRPREHPRANIVSAKGGQVSLPTLDHLKQAPAQEAVASSNDFVPAPLISEGLAEPVEDPQREPFDVAQPAEIIVKRRRYRRRRNKVRASSSASPSAPPASGLFSQLFQRKARR